VHRAATEEEVRHRLGAVGVHRRGMEARRSFAAVARRIAPLVGRRTVRAGGRSAGSRSVEAPNRLAGRVEDSLGEEAAERLLEGSLLEVGSLGSFAGVGVHRIPAAEELRTAAGEDNNRVVAVAAMDSSLAAVADGRSCGLVDMPLRWRCWLMVMQLRGAEEENCAPLML
jgi:hypothetical protein